MDNLGAGRVVCRAEDTKDKSPHPAARLCAELQV